MVEAATTATAKACSAQTTVPAANENAPNWDAMANSFASLSSAFAWGSLLLAIVAIVAALAWGWFVKGWAEKEAQKEAKACADAYIQRWLSDEAPGLIRQHVEFLMDATLGSGDDAGAADEIGEAAG
jgi:hypothetical protein